MKSAIGDVKISMDSLDFQVIWNSSAKYQKVSHGDLIFCAVIIGV